MVGHDKRGPLTLTPGEQPGSPIQAAVNLATPDFLVENDVVTSASDVKSDLTLTREPGSSLVVIKGTMPAKGAPRKLVLAIEEPAQHAAAVLKRLLEERGVKIAGAARARPDALALSGDSAVLAERVSVPLEEEVQLVNNISHNLDGEMLAVNVAQQGAI